MMTRGRKMTIDQDGIGAKRSWRWLRIVVLGTVILFLAAYAAGFVVAHIERGHALSTKAGLILAGIAFVGLGCAWLLIRAIREPTGEEPLTRKERLNRNLLILSGAIGGLMAVAIIMTGEGHDHASVFSSAPLPPATALAMVLGLGLLVPAVSIYWHRAAIDEQEADAYKTGALYAMYLYMVGAPVWWFAWRGGFAGEPNGVILYFLTVITLGAVWLWKKHA